jgi:D-sedoheptulose 7-phosphate isomerase
MLAVEAARQRKMQTIALTGVGGKLRDLADVTIAVPSTSTQHIQESHLAIEHIICDLVEQSLFRPGADAGSVADPVHGRIGT